MKNLLLFIIFIIGLFIFYKKEYLYQAVPVYMQYLEQKDKWERVNSKTYVYLQFHNGGVYYFVKDNDLVYTLDFGSGYSLQSLKDKEKSKDYWKDIGYRRFGLEKDYLIESRFQEIQSILWKKLWDGIALQSYPKSELYSIEILYNHKYGYPMMISHILHDKRGDIIQATGANCITKSSWHTSSIQLKILSKDTQYNTETLENVLDEIKGYYKNTYPNTELIETVGTSSIKGKVLRVLQ